MSLSTTEKVAGFLSHGQKAVIRKALGRSMSRKKANVVIAAQAGITGFFSTDEAWEAFHATIASDAPDFLQEEAPEYGDFQTPPALAKRVCERLRQLGCRPTLLIEPTCGRGNFILAALEVFPSIRTVFGMDIQEGHVAECKTRLLTEILVRPGLKREISIRRGNIFADFPLSELAQRTGGRPLILGNPPWVTNTSLSLLESSNLPTKTNFKGHSGLDALTGKSNFDIAEFILLQLIQGFAKSRATVAMLCKNTVIRNLVEATRTQLLPISNIRAFRFNASTEFGVACDASLFVCNTTTDPGAKTCAITGLGEDAGSKTFGWVGENFVAHTGLYARARQIEGTSHLEWRQGLKHDCSAVMELSQTERGWHNGLGEPVKVEPERVFPLAKSSDLKLPIVTRVRKAVIVTQNTVGEDTAYLAGKHPRLWKYLCGHGKRFAARGSVIYRNKPLFSIFGIGDYSFKLYKIAMSGLYKSSHFTLLPPIAGKPVMLDDTCYLLGFDELGQAAVALGLLNSQAVQDFLESIVFSDSKRPYTKDVLMRIDLRKVASIVPPSSIRSYLSTLGRSDLDFTREDFDSFLLPAAVEEQTQFLMERGSGQYAGRRG